MNVTKRGFSFAHLSREQICSSNAGMQPEYGELSAGSWCWRRSPSGSWGTASSGTALIWTRFVLPPSRVADVAPHLVPSPALRALLSPLEKSCFQSPFYLVEFLGGYRDGSASCHSRQKRSPYWHGVESRASASFKTAMCSFILRYICRLFSLSFL